MLNTHMTYTFQNPGKPFPTEGISPSPIQNPNGQPTLEEVEATLTEAGLPALSVNTDLYRLRDGRPAYVVYAALDITVFFGYSTTNSPATPNDKEN